MISFSSDYTKGAHEEILKALCETNYESLPGYLGDKYTLSAIKKLKEYLDNPSADIYFLVGGTQTNQIVISTMLSPYMGVISAKTGHVAAHEAGAIEYTGHKILELDTKDGKIQKEILLGYLESFYQDENHTHMVFPGMVYISNPTEYGTIYTKAELNELYNTCKEYNLILYIDGARLGYALTCDENDCSLSDISKICDVFYIGGTKVGALLGEAVVFTHNNTPKQFITQVKQHGGLLAKSRVLGIQFDRLFTSSLYFKISRVAIEKAKRLKEIL